MVVIISVSRLDNDGFEIRAGRPQRDSNPAQEYSSETKAHAVLLGFGISEEAIGSHLNLKLLSQMGANEQLNFPPMDVPRHDLLSRGFRL